MGSGYAINDTIVSCPHLRIAFLCACESAWAATAAAFENSIAGNSRLIDRSGIEYHILFSNKTLWHSGVPEQAILSDLKLEPARYVAGLRRIFDHFRQKYDYIIVDTRGGYDFTSAAPALLSDSYIVVLEPDRVSLEQIQGYEKAIKEFAVNHSIRIPLRGFVVNKASFDPNETRFVEELTRTYSIKTYGVIPADISCIRAYETTDSPILRFPYSDFFILVHPRDRRICRSRRELDQQGGRAAL